MSQINVGLKDIFIMTENPFITYGYESADYFCDRKAETHDLITILTNFSQ